MDFYFEEWAFLAKVDPEAFEMRRKQVLEDYLAGASGRHRFLGNSLQCEIDSVRTRAPDANASLAAIATMMWQQVDFLCEGLTSLSECVRDAQQPLSRVKCDDRVAAARPLKH